MSRAKRKIIHTLVVAMTSTLSVMMPGSCNLVSEVPKESGAWTTIYKRLGTLSSPHLVDLNEDEVLDVVMGAGTIEFHKSDSAVIALDGRDGELMWTSDGRDQLFGSAMFKDITDDQIADVLIGGRAAQLKAIDGENGDTIWEYFPGTVDITKSDSGAYNFYIPQFIPDQDNDGLERSCG